MTSALTYAVVSDVSCDLLNELPRQSINQSLALLVGDLDAYLDCDSDGLKYNAKTSSQIVRTVSKKGGLQSFGSSMKKIEKKKQPCKQLKNTPDWPDAVQVPDDSGYDNWDGKSPAMIDRF